MMPALFLFICGPALRGLEALDNLGGLKLLARFRFQVQVDRAGGLVDLEGFELTVFPGWAGAAPVAAGSKGLQELFLYALDFIDLYVDAVRLLINSVFHRHLLGVVIFVINIRAADLCSY